MVAEGELGDREVLHCLLLVLVLALGAEVVNLDHVSMVLSEKVDNIDSAVSEHRLVSVGRESTGDDPISDVGQIEIVAISNESGLVSGHLLADPVHAEALHTVAATFLLSS